jgi:polyisoprenoid-binding protein YceI
VDGAAEKSSVTVDIDAGSITSDTEKLTGHLKSADFFDVVRFPKATFASTAVKAGGDRGATHTITGNLTLHGVTKAITFPATVRIAGDEVSVDSDFAINRKDFAINYPGKQDDLIRDDVVIRLSIHAKRPS